MLHGVLHHVGDAVQAEQLHDLLPVEFDSSRRDPQDFRDFLIAASFRDQLHHLPLTASRERGALVRPLVAFDLRFNCPAVDGG